MNKLIMMYGLPGSGKSSWAENYVKKSNGGAVRLNKDTMREQLFGSRTCTRSQEKKVLKARDNAINLFLSQGLDVIVDDTNLAPKHKERLSQLARENRAEFEIQDFSHVSPRECIEADAQRTHSVGAHVINRMYQQFLYKDPVQKSDVFFSTNSIIVDIDGTLADNKERSPFAWDKVEGDMPYFDIVKLVDTLSNDYRVIFVSGRDEAARKGTEKWLSGYFDWFDHGDLFMRPAGNTEPDEIIKERIYREFIEDQLPPVSFVLDDRNKVVEMWRRIGLRCLQVAPGEF